MVTVQYFGVFKEILGVAKEEIDYKHCKNTVVLLAYLRKRSAVWSDTLAEEKIFRLVVNNQIIYKNVDLKNGDEIGILPPVTGG
ncbi:MoaD/ThiS family protein [Commensalibacter sp. Nvir]|uniref:MoaD/ThiS family protein n=1 Tax=Commensalibacter sp. Nvir TaxID=3069817 RepID=UPI0030C7EAEE